MFSQQPEASNGQVSGRRASPATDTPSVPGDGAERILGASVDLFGRQGVKGTSLKAIAAQAGVSPALIVHHFGSKEALHVACDQHVARILRTTKTATVQQGQQPDPVSVLRLLKDNRPVVRYLARALSDGSPHVDELVDEMVADAERYTQEGVDAGIIRPSTDPHARVVVLFLWSLGTLVLHEHLERLLGESLLDGDEPPRAYLRAVLEIYSEGIFADGAYEGLRAHVSDDSPAGTTTDDDRTTDDRTTSDQERQR